MLNGLISLLARIVVSIELDSAVGKRIVRQSASRKQITSDDGTTDELFRPERYFIWLVHRCKGVFSFVSCVSVIHFWIHQIEN